MENLLLLTMIVTWAIAILAVVAGMNLIKRIDAYEEEIEELRIWNRSVAKSTDELRIQVAEMQKERMEGWEEH